MVTMSKPLANLVRRWFASHDNPPVA